MDRRTFTIIFLLVSTVFSLQGNAQVGLAINNGDKFTNSTDIKIRILSSWVDQVMLSNDPDFLQGEWQPFSRLVSWQIPKGDGKKTVYFKYRDKDGNESATYTASVILDTAPPKGNEVVIAEGNNYINQRDNITVHLKSQDAAFAQLSEREDFQHAKWFVFREKYGFTFSAGDEKKALFARFKDAAGNISEPVADSIILDSQYPQNGIVSIFGENVVVDSITGRKYLEEHNSYLNLTLHADEAKYMRIVNGNSFYAVKWQLFKEEFIDWELENYKDGEYRVSVQYMDKAQNPSNIVTDVVYVDTHPPYHCQIQINEGAEYATGHKVTLQLSAVDARYMQVSHDFELEDEPWLPYQSEMTWELEKSEKNLHEVYVRLKDVAGNITEILKDDILLDLEPPAYPSIVINRGAERSVQPSVTLNASAEDAVMMQIGRDSAFRSGRWMFYTEEGLPLLLDRKPGKQTFFARFADQAGNITKPVTTSIYLEEAPARYWVSIYRPDANNFTQSNKATLMIGAGNATEMKISNDPDMSTVEWQPFQKKLEWDLLPADGEKTVYAQFRSKTLTESEVVSDAIVVDATPPEPLSIRLNKGEGKTPQRFTMVELKANAAVLMQISEDSTFAHTTWKRYRETPIQHLFKTDHSETKTIYARFMDEAGNISKTISADIVYELMPTAAYIRLNHGQEICKSATGEVHVKLFAHHATEMCLSNRPDFAGAEWQPYSPETTWLLPKEDGEHEVFVKFRSRTLTETIAESDRVILNSHPPQNLSLVLNNGAPKTDNFYVYARLTATDVSSMQVSISPDFKNTDWQAYTSEPVLVFLGTAGGPTKVYARFRDKYGYVSETISQTIQVDVAPANCRLLIDQGMPYTTQPERKVMLRLWAGNAQEMMISNQPDFNGATWQPFRRFLTWTLSEGNGEKSVYAKFKSHTGTESGVLSSKILLDNTPPQQTAISANNTEWLKRFHPNVVQLKVRAQDAHLMQISEHQDFSSASWEAFTDQPFPYRTSPGAGEKTIYARFKDQFGNISEPASTTVVIDDAPPTSYAAFLEEDAPATPKRQAKLSLSAQGATQFRAAHSEQVLKTAEWQPVTESHIWSLPKPETDGTKHIFVQFRDAKGNASHVISDFIDLDTEAPTAPSLSAVDGTHTNSRLVALRVDAKGATRMIVSNNPDFEGAAWQRYRQGEIRWLLPEGDGSKTVYAKFSDEAGNESPLATLQLMLDTEMESPAPIKINNAAFVTKERNVSLQLNAPGATQMLISNNPQFSVPAKWQPYAPTTSWQLDHLDGLKKVWVRFRDEAGNETLPVFAEIWLDTEPPVLLGLKLNGGETAAESPDITVAVKVKPSQHSPEVPDATGIQLSNTGQFNAADWQNIGPELNWRLQGSPGLKKVYVRFKDQAGNISRPIYREIMLY